MVRRWKVVLVALTAGLLAWGCTQSAYVNPDEPDKLGGTGIDSQDVRTVSQEMARDLIAADFAQQLAGKPVIALLPTVNQTRFRIDTDIMTLQMRDLLITNAGLTFTFVARERMGAVRAEREAKRAGDVSSSSDKMVSGADYFLTATLLPISKSAGGQVSDYIYYSFQLIDAESTEVVWAKGYDIKKVGKRGVLYR